MLYSVLYVCIVYIRVIVLWNVATLMIAKRSFSSESALEEVSVQSAVFKLHRLAVQCCAMPIIDGDPAGSHREKPCRIIRINSDV